MTLPLTGRRIGGSTSIECECSPHFTCGYCLRNAKPWIFTPSTFAEQIARQIARDTPKEPKAETPR